MFPWTKKKSLPEFWMNYANHFRTKKKLHLQTTRFVIFDTETTGLHIKNDRILSIGAIGATSQTMNIGDTLELYVKQDVYNPKTAEIHGILKEGSMTRVEEKQAIVFFLEFIKGAILVAHHAAFDISMINTCLKRLSLPKLKNKVLDTGDLFKKTTICPDKNKHYSLDELSAIFNIKKQDRHTAAGDAYITGILFLKIVSHLIQKRHFFIKDLFFRSNRKGLL
ncbi:3'-5' exonuclease [Aquimarina spongiae]|uniref:DNA polymerase-3 subunit epsilon n=1 Tax=Aquimarina spongiae TaxID=570521 RepID=A0A1M6GEB3_9FLAO|nr:3'-5' exonuclease [Aquimarina spongiae]SHJ08269.1 DNA polymerase-3 subunit epsilon [Aquimarina spongiae]